MEKEINTSTVKTDNLLPVGALLSQQTTCVGINSVLNLDSTSSSLMMPVKKPCSDPGFNNILKSSSQLLLKNKQKYKLIHNSPLKASPVKGFSHIIRKRKKPKNKGFSPRKLKFILPKVTKFSIRKGKLRTIKSKSLKSTHKDFSILHHQNSQKKGSSSRSLKIHNSELEEEKTSQTKTLTGEEPVEETVHRDILIDSPPEIMSGASNTLEEYTEEIEEEEPDDGYQQQQEEYLAALLKASSTIASQKSSEKKISNGGQDHKLTKQQKRLQERIAALSYTPNLSFDRNVLIISYLVEVKEALANVKPSKFDELVTTLKNISPSYSVEKAYFKVMEILNGFPSLQEGFLMFLTPDQAVRVGKYHEYLMIQAMRTFADELKHHLSKQPQNMQKVIRALQAATQHSNLNNEHLFNSLKSILKMQPWLLESFSKCIATSKPQRSLPEDFEDINLDGNFSVDEFEVINLVDEDPRGTAEKCICDCHSTLAASTTTTAKSEHCLSCSLKFIDGRVFLQCGKALKPAKVTFVKRNDDSSSVFLKGSKSSEMGKKECRHLQQHQQYHQHSYGSKRLIQKGITDSEGEKPRKGRKSKKS